MSFKKILLVGLMLIQTSIYATTQNVATKQDIEEIRQELKLLVEAYEYKIRLLEKRLLAAEDANEETLEKTDELAIELSQQGNQTAPNTYNPGIGLVLNGQFLTSDSNADSGLALGESEMNLSANIDDKFHASVTLAFGEGAEVEEAFIETISMPNGLNIKAGRFFSNIGYLANKHAHTDNFTTRPLAYETFLGGQFTDDGIQLNWLAPTDLYWQTGFELYRGDSFPAAGSANNGSGLWTAYTHIGDDINQSQSWRLGLSYLNAKADDRQTEEGESFSGDSELWIADFVWKWAPNGNPAINNAIIQAEYLHRNEQGLFTDLASNSQLFDSKESGWYIDGIYQFIPQWRVGLRYSETQADSLGANFASHDPSRYSLMIDWSNSEFSRIRLQYSEDHSQLESDSIWTLQYIAAFGAHGSHSF